MSTSKASDIALEQHPQAVKTHLLNVLNEVTIQCSYTLAKGAAVAGEQVVFVAPRAVTIVALTWVSEGAITANSTNNQTISVENKTATKNLGVGHAFDTTTTDDLAAFGAWAFALTATAADLTISAGDVITFKNAVAASGVAVPAGSLMIWYKLA